MVGRATIWRGQVVIEDRMDKGAHRVIPQAIMLYSQH